MGVGGEESTKDLHFSKWFLEASTSFSRKTVYLSKVLRVRLIHTAEPVDPPDRAGSKTAGGGPVPACLMQAMSRWCGHKLVRRTGMMHIKSMWKQLAALLKSRTALNYLGLTRNLRASHQL